MESRPKEHIEALVKQEGVRRVDLSVTSIEREVLDLVPPELAMKFRVIPINFKEKRIDITSSNPFDLYARRALELRTGRKPHFYYTPEEQMQEWIERLYFPDQRNGEESEASQSELEFSSDSESAEFDIQVMPSGDEAPAIRFVDSLLKQAIQSNASDIHIEPTENEVIVRMRIDGVLSEAATIGNRYRSAVISRVKIMAGLDIAERRIPLDGRIRLKVFGRNIDVRVSTLPTLYAEKIVMRILDKEKQSLDIDDLGLEKELNEKFIEALQQPYGMILVTGPTGSGKTTTLYSALNYVASPEKNLITVEDPVEYRLNGINQVPARPEVGLTFASGLRAILRQDPDVVMVGEIRDTETAEIAIRAALTGHLVFSTLHTNDGISTIMRLMDMRIDPYLICNSLSLVIAQRLVRRCCLHCIEPYEVEEKMLEKFERDRELLKDITFARGTGCDVCGGSGYSGRIAIFELFYLNNKIRSMILSDATSDELLEAGLNFGMETLQKNGLRKVTYGLTTIDEVIRLTSDSFQ